MKPATQLSKETNGHLAIKVDDPVGSLKRINVRNIAS